MAVTFEWPGKNRGKQSVFEQNVSSLWSPENMYSGNFESDLAVNVGNREFIYNGLSHLMLVGDNFEIMGDLISNSLRKFSFIYIDPPYNSSKNFAFTDSFGTSEDPFGTESWLDFMYPRLLRGYELLANDGFLFVSIDDREMPVLASLLREIFGRQNHVGTFKWKKKRKPSFLAKNFSSTLEYILVFCRDVSKAPPLKGLKSTENTRPVLNASNEVASRVLRAGTKCFCKDGVYVGGDYGVRSLFFSLENDAVIENQTLQNEVKVTGRFRVSQEILDRSVFITKMFGLRREVNESEKSERTVVDFDDSWPTNEDAQQETKSLFGGLAFEYAKPLTLLKILLKMIPIKNDEPMHCLDFFAGSGTLGQAVLELNRSDGKKRFFSLIQNKEPVNLTFNQRVSSNSRVSFKTIDELMKYRIRTAESQLKTDAPALLFFHEKIMP